MPFSGAGDKMFWNRKKEPEKGRVCLQHLNDYVLNVRMDKSVIGDRPRFLADILTGVDMHSMFISNSYDYVRLGISTQGDDVYVLKDKLDIALQNMKVRGCDTCYLKDYPHILYEHAKSVPHEEK